MLLNPLTGVGDRRCEDITALASEAARIFDEIIIRHDDDMRGKNIEELDRLLTDGIKQVDPEKKITIIDTERHAVEPVLIIPVPGCLSVIFADNIQAVITQVQKAWTRKPSEVLEVA